MLDFERYSNKAVRKRDLFVEDVLKSDESVEFYTGIPSHACLPMLFNVHHDEAQKLKYWDKNKNKTVCCHNQWLLQLPFQILERQHYSDRRTLLRKWYHRFAGGG